MGPHDAGFYEKQEYKNNFCSTSFVTVITYTSQHRQLTITHKNIKLHMVTDIKVPPRKYMEIGNRFLLNQILVFSLAYPRSKKAPL